MKESDTINNKRRVITGTIIILSLSFLFHSVYDKFPNTLTSLFFPVNESIFEHNKMTLLSFLIWGIIEKLIFNRAENVIEVTLLESILCIIILNFTFTPIYLFILNKKENLILTIIIYAISIILSLVLGNKRLTPAIKKRESISFLGFSLLFAIFMILTYNPPKLAIFYDYKNSLYGIPQEQIAK